MRRVARTLAVSMPLAFVAGACDGRIVEPPGPRADPGHVTVHRLNNIEYDNTVRDLLGTSLRPATDFPDDDSSYGFDNIADVLSLSPIQVELYQRAAATLAAEAMHAPVFSQEHRVEGEETGGTTGQVHEDRAWVFLLPGRMETTIVVPEPGPYRIGIRAWGDQAGPELVRMEVRVDGTLVSTFTVDTNADAPATYEVEAELAAGPVGVSAEFINDYYIPETGEDRNLYIDWIAATGPLDATGTNPIRDSILICDPSGDDAAACARDIVAAFGRRAWRRPLTNAELAELVGVFELVRAEGGDAHRGIELAIERMLSSVHFLFRIELDADPTSLEPRPLDDYEIASRLSYFLWSSMPDDELLDAAAAGTLRDRTGRRQQVDRMLVDPKADALIANFGGQWLNLRGARIHAPDYTAFPEFDDALRQAMLRETEMLLRALLTEERSVHELLTADFTYVDAQLAAHYGMAFDGPDTSEVSLADTPRRGLLGHASVLMVTSYPTRTSPVKRGQWVLEQLLCSGPPPPPPGVEGLPEDGPLTGSIRDRMDQHRTDPVCISCHQAMDPIGFALEHFDGVGAWRDADGEFAIDATGVLPDGQSFDGAVELAHVLAADPRFTRCLAEKLMTYAVGRGLGHDDETTLDALHRAFVADGATMGALIRRIVDSEPFLYRRGEPGGDQ